MTKKWENYDIDEEKINQVAAKYGLTRLLAKILLNRGIDTPEKIDKFLYPKRSDMYNPFDLTDMNIAVDRVIRAIEEKQKVAIYGDYDVDGITSIAVLKKFLNELGVDNVHYLPNRLDEGYGLNRNALEKIKSQNVDLIITVDCGISGIDEIEYAKELGMDVIVTDHHECQITLPSALAVIDPKRKDNAYPFNALAGVGVTFKLIQAISERLNLSDETYLKYLDIVCLGTVADIVPLVDENRIIVKYGLEKIRSNASVGINALISIIGYKTIDSNAISFGIAPRINACGRMGEAEIALRLLLTDDVSEANEIAIKLQEMNKERQNVEKRIFEDAIRIIERDKLYENNIIVVGNENWHHGVIGIVASKITDMYYKPSILVCFEGEDAKGSGRSIDGFDLHDALTHCSNNLERFGGHEMAIGLSMKLSNFEAFRDEIVNYTDRIITCENVPIVKVDAEVTAKDISLKTIEDLKLLEPYGEANSAPVLAYKNIKVDSVRTLSEDKHLKLNVKDGNIMFNAIAFNMGNKKDTIRMGDRVDILMYMEVNHFNGTDSVQLNVKDIKRSL